MNTNTWVFYGAVAALIAWLLKRNAQAAELEPEMNAEDITWGELGIEEQQQATKQVAATPKTTSSSSPAPTVAGGTTTTGKPESSGYFTANTRDPQSWML